MDYRTFLIEEADAAGEAVPMERKFNKLTDLVTDVTWENFTDGMDALIMRISYVNFFALTMRECSQSNPVRKRRALEGLSDAHLDATFILSR